MSSRSQSSVICVCVYLCICVGVCVCVWYVPLLRVDIVLLFFIQNYNNNDKR